ncbi:MAG: 16S rRNA (guanine(527)-N(7))-methyltransferase RsmG [Chitinophagales bacterium]
MIEKYFKQLTPLQLQRFQQLPSLYAEWNEKINVVSRKDIDNLEERHVLHALAIAKMVTFKDGAKIMDLGTGGGFPGVPLAILFPEARFHLVDSIGKKLKVIEAVKEALDLKNVFTFHCRAESMDFQYDFVVSRAVAPLPDLLQWTKGKYAARHRHEIRNGLICLKGGDLTQELEGISKVEKKPLSDFFNEPFFEQKFLVYKSY